MSQNTLSENELKALVSLLGDSDPEVVSHVEERIASLGDEVIPLLEKQWEESFDPGSQKRIEDIIHQLQFERLREKLIVWKSGGGEDLLEGLWLLATYQYPDLDIHSLRDQVQQLYYEAWLEFKPEAKPREHIDSLNSVFFNKFKFAPNTGNFHSIGNSMINVVLENRKGNPISLCCLYLLVAQKMRLPVYGVNLPNLFILIYEDEKEPLYINVFNKGLIFRRREIDRFLDDLKIEKSDIFYDACSHVTIIRRMLRNMMRSFELSEEVEKQDEIRDLLQAITDDEDPYAGN